MAESQVMLRNVLIQHKPLVWMNGSCWTQFRNRGSLSYYGVNLTERRRPYCCLPPHMSMIQWYADLWMCTVDAFAPSFIREFFWEFESQISSIILLFVKASCFMHYIIAVKKGLKAYARHWNAPISELKSDKFLDSQVLFLCPLEFPFWSLSISLWSFMLCEFTPTINLFLGNSYCLCAASHLTDLLLTCFRTNFFLLICTVAYWYSIWASSRIEGTAL